MFKIDRHNRDIAQRAILSGVANMRRIYDPKIQTRLAPEDRRRFQDLCDERNITMSEFAREIILGYLDGHRTQAEEHRESKIERRLKTIEDRYASLLVRIGIDTGTMMALLSSRIDPSKRKEILDTCYQVSVRHFHKKLEGVSKEMKQQLSEMSR
jgi:hypothetical protein